MAIENDMIKPFEPDQIKQGNISYGLSSYGYDIRIADEFKIFKPLKEKDTVVDPKNIDATCFEDVKSAEFIIPPGALTLTRSFEYFKIPRSVLALCTGKSTYARVGIMVNITPLEPCWEGFITIAVSNVSADPVKLYANEGLAQVVFFESDQECAIAYSDRKGRYQAQKQITLPK